MASLTLDSGALIAYERGDAGVRARLERARELGVVPIVSTAAVAEVWRSSTQVRLTLLLRGCSAVAVSQAISRGWRSARTGQCGHYRRHRLRDSGGSFILTSDSADLLPLAARHPSLKVVQI